MIIYIQPVAISQAIVPIAAELNLKQPQNGIIPGAAGGGVRDLSSGMAAGFCSAGGAGCRLGGVLLRLVSRRSGRTQIAPQGRTGKAGGFAPPGAARSRSALVPAPAAAGYCLARA